MTAGTQVPMSDNTAAGQVALQPRRLPLLLLTIAVLFPLIGDPFKDRLLFAAGQQPTAPRPNVVLIVADDMGWGDLGVQGAAGFSTPQLDQLAAAGTRFTSFYVAQAVCTASRAALMTGCYPNRLGMQGAYNHTSRDGVAAAEWLLPEMFRDCGYAVGGFGKWHLGTRPAFHPLRHGFDEWLGIPYSNDNSKYHPVLAAEMPPLPFYDGERVVELDPDQSRFTQRFTRRAIEFMERHVDRPFFVYLPHVMPHVPIFASPEFAGRSRQGVYGDVMQELDASVGELLGALERLQLTERTLVIFISDNGPFLSYGNHAGSAGPLREGKLTTFEGGVRVPCVVRWPGKVPAGRVCDVPFMGIDWLPTLTELAGGKLPELPIDGRSAAALLLNRANAPAPHEFLYFYSGTALQAVRSGPWKLHFPHPFITPAGAPGKDGKPSGFGTLAPASIRQSGVEGIATRHGYRIEMLEESLFHLETDPGERMNLAQQHPDIVQRLRTAADGMRQELGDSLRGISGRGQRAPGLDSE
jgi:arylsulfatase